MKRVVLFLRGINVGRNKRIGMADLRELLGDAGYEHVRTLLQSGNVVLSSAVAPAAVAADVEQRLAVRFGFDVTVIARTAAQVTAVLKAAPLADVATDPSKHVVAFLSAKPTAAVVRELEAHEFGSERVVVDGREIYVWCPAGLQDSPAVKLLTAERLGVEVTVRNWNTVEKVVALAAPD